MNKIQLLKEAMRLIVIEEEIRLSMDSLDDQVDSILMRFESDCILGPEGEEEMMPGIGESRARLTEAPTDDEEKDPKDDEGPPSGKEPELGDPEEEDVDDKTSDKEDQEPDTESDPLKPKIDLGKFAGKVSRLVSNFEHLLNLPIAIANRASNYLEQNYGESVAKEFAEVMERDFEVQMEPPTTAEPREKPIAVGGAAGLGM